MTTSPHPTLARATVTRLVPHPEERAGAVFEVQGALALDLRGLGIPPTADPPETPELDPARQSRVAHVADLEVRAWASRYAQAVVEAVSGHRPVTQLVRWTAPGVYRDLERRVRLVARAAGPRPRDLRPQVRSAHVCRPVDDAVEVSVHVRHGERSRALAMRLEQTQGRWLCTALQFA